MKYPYLLVLVFVISLISFPCSIALSKQETTITINHKKRHQMIDGFGFHLSSENLQESWWHSLFFDDLEVSILRLFLRPNFIRPYSDYKYNSPWFMGAGKKDPLNFEDPDNPHGPEKNNVRTYTGPQDYSRLFGGRRAAIAVMGPNIDDNVKYFNYEKIAFFNKFKSDDSKQLKIIGSFWSPAPWLKMSSGNAIRNSKSPKAITGTPWPFIWRGGFVGGVLDISEKPLDIFNDKHLGGTGPTTSLTQFARSTAAYIRGYQNHYGFKFYALSIQNELNFETFYDSAFYPTAEHYIKALIAVKKEFNKYEDLKHIKILGPEDLLGGGVFGLWELGEGNKAIHKNLQYLYELSIHPVAKNYVDIFAIHGYDSEGVKSSNSAAKLWSLWANGWTFPPAYGLPFFVKGFNSYNKKSWMTETSGEDNKWLHPEKGFPGNGAWSIALKIHQALTIGEQSAWLYWQFYRNAKEQKQKVHTESLTDQFKRDHSAKYNATKHFFKFIRPGSQRVQTKISGSKNVLASSYIHDKDKKLTIVLINKSNEPTSSKINLQTLSIQKASINSYTSFESHYWRPSDISENKNILQITSPGFSVTTIHTNIQ